jgi:hypothetical protein
MVIIRCDKCQNGRIGDDGVSIEDMRNQLEYEGWIIVRWANAPYQDFCPGCRKGPLPLYWNGVERRMGMKLRKRIDDIQTAAIKLSTETVVDYESAKAIFSMFTGVSDENFQLTVENIERLAASGVMTGQEIVDVLRLIIKPDLA